MRKGRRTTLKAIVFVTCFFILSFFPDALHAFTLDSSYDETFNQVKLWWQKPSGAIVGSLYYKIYYSSSAVNYPNNSFTEYTTVYTDYTKSSPYSLNPGLTAGNTYYFVIKAYDDRGTSSSTDDLFFEGSVTTWQIIPFGLTGSYAYDAKKLTLNWNVVPTDGQNSANFYKVIEDVKGDTKWGEGDGVQNSDDDIVLSYGSDITSTGNYEFTKTLSESSHYFYVLGWKKETYSFTHNGNDCRFIDTSGNTYDCDHTGSSGYYFYFIGRSKTVNVEVTAPSVTYSIKRKKGTQGDVVYGDTAEFALEGSDGSTVSLSADQWMMISENSSCDEASPILSTDFASKTTNGNNLVLTPMNLGKKAKLCTTYNGEPYTYTYDSTNSILRIVYNLSGTIKYAHRDGTDTNAVPLEEGLTLTIGSKDNFFQDAQSLTVSAIGADGGNFDTTRPFFSTELVFYVTAELGNIKIVDDNFTAKIYRMNSFGDASQTYDSTVTTITPQNISTYPLILTGPWRGAFNILKYARKAYNFAQNPGLPQIPFVFNPSHLPTTAPFACTRACYDDDSGRIYLDGSAQNQWDTFAITHEFGHFVDHRIFMQGNLDVRTDFIESDVSSVGKISPSYEGFASFYSALIREANVSDLGYFVRLDKKCNDDSTTTTPVWGSPNFGANAYLYEVQTQSDGCVSFLENIETSLSYRERHLSTVQVNTAISPPQGEVGNYGRAIAASLWDVYDSQDDSNHGYDANNSFHTTYNNDRISDGIGNIWNALSDAPEDFLSFARNWISNYEPDNMFLDALAAHGIDYSKPSITFPTDEPTFYINPNTKKMQKAEFQWNTGIYDTVFAQKIKISGQMSFEIQNVANSARTYDLSTYTFTSGYFSAGEYTFSICTQATSGSAFTCSDSKKFKLINDTTAPLTTSATVPYAPGKLGYYETQEDILFPLTMTGVDTLSGISFFEVKSRWMKGNLQGESTFTVEPQECTGPATSRTCTYNFGASNVATDLQGYKFFFKIRAVDYAQNEEPYPATAQISILIVKNKATVKDVTPTSGSQKNRSSLASTECCGMTVVQEIGTINENSIILSLKNITTGQDFSAQVSHSFTFDTVTGDGTSGNLSYTIDSAYLDSNPSNGELSDGKYSLNLSISDIAGNTFSGEVTQFTVDNTPPTSQMAALPAFTNATSFTVQWSGQDVDNLSPPLAYDVQYKIGASGTWANWLLSTVNTSATFGPSSPAQVTDNTYYFQVRARDAAGNYESFPDGNGDANIVVDLTPPVVDIANVSPNYGANAQGQLLIKETVDIIGKTTDAYFEKYSVYFLPTGTSCPSGPDVETNRIVTSTTAVSTEGNLTSWATKGNVSDGAYTLCLAARDQAGNVAQNTIAVSVDNTPPDTFITTPGFSGFPVVLTSGDALIKGIVNDPNFKEYKVEFATGVPPTTGFTEIGFGNVPVGDKTKPSSDILAFWHVSELGLGDGNYTLRLTATDVLGNQTIVDRALSIDRSGPTIILIPTGTNVIKYSLSESAKITIDIVTNPKRTLIPKPGDFPKDVAPNVVNEELWDGKDGNGNLTPPGTYTFTLKAVDDAGNERTEEGKVYNTGIPSISTIEVKEETPPCCTFSISLSKEISKMDVKILKISDEKVTEVVHYPDAPFSKNGLVYEFFWDGKNKYEQLVENGDYRFALEVTDSLNNNKTLATKDFRVSNGVAPIELVQGGSGLSSDATPATGTWAQDTQLHIKQRIVDAATIMNIREELRKDIMGDDSRDRPLVYRAYTYLEIAKNTNADPSAFVWDGMKQDGSLYETSVYEYDAFDSSWNILSQTLPSVAFNLKLDAETPTFSTGFQNAPDNSFTATVSFSEPVRPYVLKVYDSEGNFVGSIENRMEHDAFETVSGVPLRQWTLVVNPLLYPSVPLPPDTYHFNLYAKDVAGNLLSDAKFEYTFEHAIDSVTGGVVWSTDGKARLYVPPGALQTGQFADLFIAENAAPPFGEGFDFLDKFYDFQPNGVTFNQDIPAILRLYYEDANQDGWVEVGGVPQNIREEDLAIYYFNPDPTVNAWIRLGGITNRTANYLEIPVFHVSLYALVYPKENILPIAQITSPTDNQVIEGVVPITGTATDANFTKYRLMVGEGTSSTT